MAGWRAPASGASLVHDAPAEAGQLPLHDAVTLSRALVLTAHGDLGVRLVGPDGRVRAGWDVPAHQFVVADHGANVLLVALRGRTREIRRLDLGTRRVHPPVVLTVHHLVPSYDGARLVAVDDDGIAFIDLGGAAPRVAWRELNTPGLTVRDIVRAPGTLAALVHVADGVTAAPALQVWRWDLPSLMLRTRQPVNVDDDRHPVLLASGAVLTATSNQETGAYEIYRAGRRAWTGDVEPTVLASGATPAVRVDRAERTTVEFLADDIRVSFPATKDAVGIRQHAGVLTVWDRAGRLVAVDPARREPVVSLRTRL